MQCVKVPHHEYVWERVNMAPYIRNHGTSCTHWIEDWIHATIILEVAVNEKFLPILGIEPFLSSLCSSLSIERATPDTAFKITSIFIKYTVLTPDTLLLAYCLAWICFSLFYCKEWLSNDVHIFKESWKVSCMYHPMKEERAACSKCTLRMKYFVYYCVLLSNLGQVQ